MTTGNSRGESREDELLEALEETLKVSPSPEFVARVRVRLRNESARSSPWRSMRLVLAGAATVVVVGAAAWWSGQTERERVEGPPAMVIPPPARASASAGRASDLRVVEAGTTTELTSIGGPGRAAVSARQAVVTGAGAPPRAATALVPDDERRALDRLLLALRAGRASVPAPLAANEDENGMLLEPAPVDIPLLKPIQPLAPTPVEPSGGTQK